MQNRLDKELEILHKEFLKLGALCELAVLNSIKSLSQNDQSLANSVFELEEKTNKKEREIEGLCLKLFLKQQPVAKDLRYLSSILKMITDFERIADQSRKIAEISLEVNLAPINIILENMAYSALKMLNASVDCYVSQNLDDCLYVINFDDTVDDFYSQIKSYVVDLVSKEPSKAHESMYLLMTAKYFERIADHATNIAKWVEFSITGIHKGANNYDLLR